MNTEVMRKTLHDSQAGKATFPEVVAALTEIGVESYFVDLVRGLDTFYMPDGRTHSESVVLPDVDIAQHFSPAALETAIRAAQVDEIRYPHFLKQAMEAGLIAYWTFLDGRRVLYFGRKGEVHVEEFPALHP